MKPIAKRQGRPAHELFTGRTMASVPMHEWMKRHTPQEPKRSLVQRLLGWR